MTAAVLVVIMLVVSASALVLVRRPLPATGGEVRIDGLSAEVEVIRNARGVPQIFADTATDLFRAQGYVHAQDRFFEMDYRRHVTSGRLAELVGDDEDAIESDAMMRTLGLRRVAEQELALLSPETSTYLQAYADGVNDYLRGRETSEIAVEYSVLSISTTVEAVEPWTPLDSLTWLKGVAWDLRNVYDSELQRAIVYTAVRDVGRVEELFPPFPEEVNATVLELGASGPLRDVGPAPADDGASTTDDGASTPDGGATPSARGAGETTSTDSGSVLLTALNGTAARKALAAADRALSAAPRLVGDGGGVGSNAWAVSGELTASGRPLLANDPHVMLSAPGVLHQVGLRCRSLSPECPFDASGFGYAGIPGVLIGQNSGLAWGLTTVPADVTDLYLERVFEDGTYVRDGERAPLTERIETIRVDGGEDVRLTVRSTGSGPIISDVVPDVGAVRSMPVPDDSPASGLRGYAVSLGWTALTPGRTLDGVLALSRAQNPAEVARAAELWDAPVQGIVFATTDGQIGFQTAGRIPQRATVTDSPVPSDGSWPRPGWDPRYDWVGVIAPTDLPAGVDPESGYVVAANQAVQPAGDGPFLTRDWDAGYRGQRIADLIVAAVDDGGPLTVEGMAAIQADTVTPYAAILVPYLLRADVPDDFVDEGVQLLRDWDGSLDTDSAAAAYFSSVWANILRLTFWDDLPETAEPDGSVRWLEVVRRLLEDPQSPWWDDRTTINVVESRDQVLGQALTEARSQLTASLGKDPTRWEWGRLHVAAPEHPVLGAVGNAAVVRSLVNPRPLAVAGGSASVNATAWNAGEWEGDFPDFSVWWSPAMRMVVDLADPDASTWVNLTGNSGHPGSRNYTDQFETWAQGRSFPWPVTEEAVREAESATLRLVPVEE